MAKILSIIAFAILLSACSTADGTKTADGPKPDEVDLAVQWGTDGYGEGFIVKPVPSAVGQFRLRLYYRDPFSTSSTSAVNRCYGHWDTQSVEGDTGKTDSGGYWRINCASGRSAEGAFVMDEDGNGSGRGIDQQGEPVRLYFGDNATPAKPE